jgi:hypothetical protein
LEVDRDAGEGRGVDPLIEATGLRYQIATRMTSWIAQTTERTVDPTDPTRTAVMPHLLAAGMSAEGVGLRMPQPSVAAMAPLTGMAAPMPRRSVPVQAPGASFGGAAPKKSAQSRSRAASNQSERYAPPLGPPQPTRHEEPPMEVDESTASPRREHIVDEDDVFDGAVPTPAPAPLRATPQATPLQGRIVSQTDDQLVVSATVQMARQWRAGETVKIVCVDGTAIEVEVDVDLTTRDGVMQAGQGVRLCLRLSRALASRVVSLRLANGTVFLL